MAPHRMKLQSPSDVVVAAEWTLGFRPEESIVVVGVGGQAPTARVDLPHDQAERDGVVAALSDAYIRHPGKVVILAWSVDQAIASAAAVAVADGLAGACDVVDLLHYDGETITGILTGQTTTIDPDQRDALAVEFIVNTGRTAPTSSRDDLAALLTSGTPLPDAVVAEAIENAESSPATRAWLTQRFEQFRNDQITLSDQDAARMLAEVSHSKENRAVLFGALQRSDRTQVALLTDLVRRSPAILRTEVAVVLGFGCWLAGDGASAWTALNHAAAPAGDVMADGLSFILEKAIHPDAWESLRESL